MNARTISISTRTTLLAVVAGLSFAPAVWAGSGSVCEMGSGSPLRNLTGAALQLNGSSKVNADSSVTYYFKAGAEVTFLDDGTAITKDGKGHTNTWHPYDKEVATLTVTNPEDSSVTTYFNTGKKVTANDDGSSITDDGRGHVSKWDPADLQVVSTQVEGTTLTTTYASGKTVTSYDDGTTITVDSKGNKSSFVPKIELPKPISSKTVGTTVTDTYADGRTITYFDDGTTVTLEPMTKSQK